MRAALPDAGIDDTWLGKVVQVVRATRTHADVRIGSSVRGAIDTAAVASSLASLRGARATDAAVGLDAALVALSGRLRLREGCARRAEDIVTELWNDVFATPDEAGGEQGGEGKAPAPTGAASSS